MKVADLWVCGVFCGVLSTGCQTVLNLRKATEFLIPTLPHLVYTFKPQHVSRSAAGPEWCVSPPCTGSRQSPRHYSFLFPARHCREKYMLGLQGLLRSFFWRFPLKRTSSSGPCRSITFRAGRPSCPAWHAEAALTGLLPQFHGMRLFGKWGKLLRFCFWQRNSGWMLLDQKTFENDWFPTWLAFMKFGG